MAIIIDGKEISSNINGESAIETARLKALGSNPALAVVLIGDDAASTIYVKRKSEACARAGIESRVITLPAATSERELLDTIGSLNSDDLIHGILVQLPLPDHINEDNIIDAINPWKDVDCFHPENIGLLIQNRPRFIPCTPAGIMALLNSCNCDPASKKAVVIGRSLIVGKPTAMLLTSSHATVTLCHSRTPNLAHEVKCADIVIAAVGKPKFVKGSWIKPGSTVIDVGINRTDEGKLIGDVDFDEALKVAGAITPVPGGVGPMTIAMLLKNTLTACRYAIEKK